MDPLRDLCDLWISTGWNRRVNGRVSLRVLHTLDWTVYRGRQLSLRWYSMSCGMVR